MVIEYLKFQVAAEFREQFIQAEEVIWNPFLANCAGFLGKEIWINPQKMDEVILIIRWETRESWKSIPEEKLAVAKKQFKEYLNFPYIFLEEAEYQLRKFG